ncbi:hypothetical protein LEMLEM_LOCUS17604 [Lemmus lemmus]
MFPPRTEKPS